MMDELEKKIVFYIEKHIPSRLTHTLEVRNLALEIAKKNNVEMHKTSLASLLHDTGKRYSEKEMRELIKKYKNTTYPDYYTEALLHSKVSVIIAEHYFNITDTEILSAIDLHTTGAPNMTMLEKIIYISDYLEATRNIESADKIREYVLNDFDKAFLDTVTESINYVLSKKKFLSEETIKLYNSLVVKK